MLIQVTDAKKSPVVLLHSSMSSGRQWAQFKAGLDERFRPIAVDLLGYGQSALPARMKPFKLQREVLAALAWIEAEIGREASFHLVGHAYGGAVALLLALACRRRIRSLALFEPVAFSLLDPRDPALAEIKAVADGMALQLEATPAEAARIFIDYWSGDGSFARLPLHQREAMSRQVTKACWDFEAVFGEPLSLSDLRMLGNMPVCLIEGLRSPWPVQRVIALLRAALPRARCHAIDGGHMAPVTHAKDVNSVLYDFVRSN